MSSEEFSLAFLQAVNDWQRGGSPTQKKRRGQRLFEEASQIDARFRQCGLVCFRQVALGKTPIWELLAERRLPETISAWTLDLNVAKTFKGGVPPEGWQGVIFEIRPSALQVVLNLTSLYRDEAFKRAVESHRAGINGYADGIGRYLDSQAELVLMVEFLADVQVHTMGGYSSDRTALARIMFQREPTATDLALFEHYREKSGIELGPWWLSPEGWQSVLSRIKPKVEELRAKQS